MAGDVQAPRDGGEHVLGPVSPAPGYGSRTAGCSTIRGHEAADYGAEGPARWDPDGVVRPSPDVVYLLKREETRGGELGKSNERSSSCRELVAEAEAAALPEPQP